MVTISWITEKLGLGTSALQDNMLLYELDKNKEGINRLEELTAQLDNVEFQEQCKNNLLGHVTNSMDTPLWAKDLNCCFLFLNEACATKILRASIEEAMHLTDIDFKQDALAKVCMISDKYVMDTMTTRRFIEHAKYQDYDLWLDVLKSPLFKNNELIGITGIGTDITSIVPRSIKEDFIISDSLEIDVNGEYRFGNGGRRKSDLRILLEEPTKGWKASVAIV